MRILFAICILLLRINGAAQHLSIKASLLSLVDEASFPTIQSGIEFKLSKKISWYNEVGVKYRKSYYEMADTNFVNPSGYKLKSEARYYLKKNTIYIACNGFYTRDFHNTEARYYYSNDSADLRIDNFSVKKNVSGFNLITGKQCRSLSRFNFEMYAGLGVRFVSIHQNNLEIDQKRDVLRRNPDLNIPDNRIGMDVKGGKSVLPNFSMGMRLCYSLK